jgi:hypothetical protein
MSVETVSLVIACSPCWRAGDSFGSERRQGDAAQKISNLVLPRSFETQSNRTGSVAMYFGIGGLVLLIIILIILFR